METDAEINLLIMLVAMTLYAVRLRYVVWKLRKAAKAAAPVGIAAPAAIAAPSPDVEQLRQRIQVLERIATDGHHSLERDIEALRHAG